MRAYLELPVVKRASGALDGRHRSVFSGHGQDFDEMVEYRPGDDIGDIDWKASAGVGEPVIRRFERQSNLAMMLVVDTSRTMAVPGADGMPKSQIAQFACDVVAYLARERGDRLALVAGDADRLVHLPGRQGVAHLELLLRRVEAMTSLEAGAANVMSLLEKAEALTADRRTVMVVVTDEAHPRPESEPVLRRLRARHEVILVRVADAPIGSLLDGPVEDVDQLLGLPPYLWGREDVRREAVGTQEHRREAVTAMIDRCGVSQVIARDMDEMLDDLVKLFARGRRART